MKSLIIPIEFFKAIGEKPPLFRICWIKWLAEYTDELFRPDFPTYFCDLNKDKNLNLETIKEAYVYGIVFFKDGFIFKNNQKKQTTISEEHQQIAEKVIDYLNQKSNSTFLCRKNNIENIVARIKEGYTLSDFMCVIDKKCRQWLNSDMEKYLRPITLFQNKKFENYLNEPETIKHEQGAKQSNISKLSNATNKAKQYVAIALSNPK